MLMVVSWPDPAPAAAGALPAGPARLPVHAGRVERLQSRGRPGRQCPAEGGEGVAGQCVVEALPALADREALRAVVLVVRDQDRGPVGIDEGDIHDLAVPPRGAERGTGDPDRAGPDEPAEMAQGVVLGVGRHGVAGADREDAGAGPAAAG